MLPSQLVLANYFVVDVVVANLLTCCCRSSRSLLPGIKYLIDTSLMTTVDMDDCRVGTGSFRSWLGNTLHRSHISKVNR